MPVDPENLFLQRKKFEIATYTVAQASAASRVRTLELGITAGSWVVSDEGQGAGFLSDGRRLSVPNMRPDLWIGIEAVGGEEFSSSIIPWFGDVVSFQGIGACIVAFTPTERITLRSYVNVHPRQIRVYGADTPVDQNSKVTLYAVFGV